MSEKTKARSRAAALAVSLAALPLAAAAAPLDVTVFNPGKEAIFPVTSTIVWGPHEAMLVDAQFQAKYAKQLIEQVQAMHRRLKYIYLSHSDPDYYFGLAQITKAFPSARVVATAQTAYLIGATKEAKVKVWKDKLGPDAPSEIPVPEVIDSDVLVIDGERVEIRRRPEDPAHTFMWIPSSRTILGGISVSTGEHLWMADTTTLDAIDAWLRIIEDMKRLNPNRVIAGHFLTPGDDSPAQLDFVRDYLTTYRKAASGRATSAEIVSAMVASYAALPGRETLEFGAKVFAGEALWHVASPYPPIGTTALVDFGGVVFRLHFIDHRTMSFEDTSGAFGGVKDTVQYQAVEVSRNVFMVYWHEPSTGSNVVHVQDWNSGTVYTNIAGKDGSFLHLHGSIKLEHPMNAR